MNPLSPSPAPHPRDLFLEAIEKPTPAERAAFLDGACRGDAALRSAVEELLANHREDSFLEGPALSVPASVNPASEQAGQRIGHYKLLQQIGEGGFGVVWMAEQELPVRRRVALKIIKLGMDTKEVIARFEQERQALAMMEHPNISKVFDAGATQSGRPFFVMELVRGVKITEYCDEQQLDTGQRLALFIQVCQAVQHAHQKGIIHRDLKPSNILVTINDGEAVPKVIDFGVAKATQGRLTDATFFTQFQQMVGTPLYMSPEQAELTSLDIDTRSDIYSLGVLLYELLTGQTPIDTTTLAKAGLDEIRRIIREVDPPRPSARVKTLDGKELTTTAKRRHTEATKLPSALSGDLDWIVMKCLEKDRSRRYDTANGLAHDLQRHLANEIVTARPPTAAYLINRLVRRNKLAVTAAVAIAASLVIGLTASVWQAVRATRATRSEQEALRVSKINEQDAKESAKRAEAERARAEAAFYKARVAVNDVVVHAAMGLGKWSGMPVQYRKIIAADALKYYEGLMQAKDAEPAVRYETGFALGSIGLMYRRLAEFDQAEKFYRRSIEVLDALVRDVPKPAEYRQQCAYQHLLFGEMLESNLQRTNEPEKEFRVALGLYETLLSESPRRLDLATELCLCYSQLILASAPPQETLTLYRKLVATAEKAGQPFFAQRPLATRPADQALREARALAKIASCLIFAPITQGHDHQLVIRMAQTSIELEPGAGKYWVTLAVGHYRAGDFKAAEAAFGKAIELKAKLSDEDEFFLAMTLWQQGNKPEALRHYETADKLRGKAAPSSIQREAAELMNVKIPPASQPTR